jgi:hypothetical protein
MIINYNVLLNNYLFILSEIFYILFEPIKSNAVINNQDKNIFIYFAYISLSKKPCP